MAITGWKLDKCDRQRLLERFPPEWPDVMADHITLDAEADERSALPDAAHAEIVGTAGDGHGLQAMVVAIAGKTRRPDGSTYHITWSLDRARGRRPIESNTLIAEHGWRALEEPVAIHILPARWG